MSPSSIDVNNTVTALLGLDMSNISSEYENVLNQELHDNTDGMNIRIADDLVNNDGNLVFRDILYFIYTIFS